MSEPQNGPYVIKEAPGKRAWCTCANSSSLPYCDGSHKGTGKAPIVVEIEEEKNVAWCGCRKSGNEPFCDGSHSQ